MLDTRTTIRNFRDLQFNLRVLLTGIRALEQGDTLVTLKWADGSVDKVPSYGMLIKYLGSAFRTLQLGATDNGATLTSDNGLHIDGKLAAKILSLVDASLVFRNCKIGSIQADVVKLGPGVIIRALESVVNLTASTLTSFSRPDSDVSYSQFSADVLSVNRLDTSKGMHKVERVHSKTGRIPMESYLTTMRDGAFRPILTLDGDMKTYDATIVTRTYNNITVYAPYIENGAPFTRFPIVAATSEVPEGEYARLSPVNLTLLYPYKMFGNTTSTMATLTMEAPREEDQYKVVTVRNVASHGIRACSVWTFNQDTYGGSRRVRIVPIRYVNIPPYSAIDFIFSFTYTNDALNAYMLPTKVLNE